MDLANYIKHPIYYAAVADVCAVSYSTGVKLGGFRSQPEAFRLCSRTEKLLDHETMFISDF